MFGWLKKKDEKTYEVTDSDNGLTSINNVDFNGKPVQIRRKRISSRQLNTNDILSLSITDDFTGQEYTKRSFRIEKQMRVDEVFTMHLEDELGYTSCLIGGFGQIGE